MKRITDHKLNGLNEALDIIATDEPGQGNACHEYEIHLLASPEAGTPKITAKPGYATQKIGFQNGPILEAGVNGISNEALLAIVIDRLRGFQSGKFACRENAVALTKLEEGMMWLQKRTRDREARGVEGRNII